MLRLKCIFFRAGIALLRLAYSFLKMLPVQRKYLFMTKLSSEPPFDFKLLSDALARRCPEHRVVMLCRPMDATYVFHIFVQMYHMATSEVVFLERSCMVVHVLEHRSTLQIVQLWHALGSMKKFGYAILDSPEGQPRLLAETMRMHRGYTSILISSVSFIDDFIEGFGTDGSNVVEIPLPRVDALLDKEYRKDKRLELLNRYPRLSRKTNILYCPTFRKAAHAASEKHQAKISELVDLIDLDKCNFIYSPHPVSDVSVPDERVVRLPLCSSQELLFVADVVITDYSSIVYEAGLLDIPTYIYAYDWEEYQLNRSHNIDLEQEMSTVFHRTATGLVESLRAGCYDHEAFCSFVRKNVSIPIEGTCCDAIIDLVERNSFSAGSDLDDGLGELYKEDEPRLAL